MNRHTFSVALAWRLRLAWHRSLQGVGWAGMLGLALLLLAAGLGMSSWSAWRERQAVLVDLLARQSLSIVPQDASLTDAAAATVAGIALPLRSDTHVLIGRLHAIAVKQQLQWQTADYRFRDATADNVARLEVQGTLKGPYPQLRAWLTDVKTAIPTVVLQEVRFSRPSAEVPEVDAKLVLAIPLQDALSDGRSPAMVAARGTP